MTSDEQVKYNGLISLRNTELTLRWTRTQLFLFINSIGVPLVITQQLQHRPGPAFRIATGLIGLGLMYLWSIINHRSNRWNKFWEAQLIFLEELPQDTQFRVFGSKDFISVRWDHPVMGKALRNLIRAFTILWVIVLLSILIW